MNDDPRLTNWDIQIRQTKLQNTHIKHLEERVTLLEQCLAAQKREYRDLVVRINKLEAAL